MSSPTEALIEWYLSIPLSHREDIAGIAGMCLPAYESITISDDTSVMVEKFIDITKSTKGNVFKEVASVASLRAFIQLFFIDKRSNKSDWKETEKALNYLAKSKDSETFERMSREVRFKAEQWEVSCKKWESLVAEHISDNHLRLLI